MTTRREMIGLSAALLGLDAIGLARAAAEKTLKPLDILILGGTGFVGPPQVATALARGHRVAIFNRGKSVPADFGNRVEVLIGNRDARIDPGLTALTGTRRWDVVIDNSGYLPRHVRDSAELLKDRVGRYLYVSTIAVYDLARGGRFDEHSPLLAAPGDTETVNWDTYGPLKAECDRLVQATFGARATIVRPSFIFGPGDETDRFTYWIERVNAGGMVLGPPQPKRELQWIDVRDLSPWIITLAERDRPGILNAAGPARPVDWQQVLQQLAKSAKQPVSFRWATSEALEQTKIDLPLGLPLGKYHVVNEAAQAAGLKFLPLSDTVAATTAWWDSVPAERRAAARGWPTAEQEQAALRILEVKHG